MPYSIVIHAEAESDLDRLWDDPGTQEAAARIDVLLEELEGDQDLLDALTVHDFGKSKREPMHVSKWLAFWRAGKDLWRLKIWDLEAKGLRYRIVYAYEPGKQRYHVLAVVPRSFNYDVSHETTRRILSQHQQIFG